MIKELVNEVDTFVSASFFYCVVLGLVHFSFGGGIQPFY